MSLSKQDYRLCFHLSPACMYGFLCYMLTAVVRQHRSTDVTSITDKCWEHPSLSDVLCCAIQCLPLIGPLTSGRHRYCCRLPLHFRLVLHVLV